MVNTLQVYVGLRPDGLGTLLIDVNTRHGTASLGHRVNGSFGSSFTSGSQGHRVIILTRCETRVFPVFEKNAQNAKRTFEMLK